MQYFDPRPITLSIEWKAREKTLIRQIQALEDTVRKQDLDRQRLLSVEKGLKSVRLELDRAAGAWTWVLMKQKIQFASSKSIISLINFSSESVEKLIRLIMKINLKCISCLSYRSTDYDIGSAKRTEPADESLSKESPEDDADADTDAAAHSAKGASATGETASQSDDDALAADETPGTSSFVPDGEL